MVWTARAVTRWLSDYHIAVLGIVLLDLVVLTLILVVLWILYYFGVFHLWPVNC